MTDPAPSAQPAHFGWRLLALVYDLFPVFALYLVFGAAVTALAYAFGHPDLSGLPWAAPLLMTGAWAFTGAYFVLSWSRGGQTLGMRPWRLRVVAEDGGSPTRKALMLRYALATGPALLALELAALLPWPEPRTPFWIALGIALAGWAWCLVDREGATLYERCSATRFVRLLNAA